MRRCVDLDSVPRMETADLDLPVPEFVALRQRDEPMVLLDVREPWEWDIVRLPGATLIPLAKLIHERETLPPGTPVVVYCHHGVRSRRGALMLRESGRTAVSLVGGIDAYAQQVDPAMARY